MTSIDYSSQHEYRPHLSQSNHVSPPKALLSATWQVLEQPPPPTLREILSAYRSRGDGDREMLMAMLNAKSAEDQRISSIASLHRSMLEYYQYMPESPAAHPRDPHSYPSNSPPYQNTLPPLQQYPHSDSTHSSPRQRRQHPDSSTSDVRPRKRSRTSQSPPPNHRSTASNPSPAPSPPRSVHSPSYSSVRSDSADHSPRSQGAMAIDSLLSAHSSREELASSSSGSKRTAPTMNGLSEYTSAVRGHPRRESNHSVAAVSG